MKTTVGILGGFVLVYGLFALDAQFVPNAHWALQAGAFIFCFSPLIPILLMVDRGLKAL